MKTRLNEMNTELTKRLTNGLSEQKEILEKGLEMSQSQISAVHQSHIQDFTDFRGVYKNFILA